MKNTPFFLLLLLLLACSAAAQPPSTVPKGRIYTADGDKITFKDLSFGTEAHRYQNGETGKALTIPADNVLSVEQQTGNEAGRWALIMGGSGLLGSLLGVWRAKLTNDENGIDPEDQPSYAPIVVGFTAGSALLGLAIGASKKTYKTVYTNPKYESTTMSPTVRIGITCSAQQGAGIGLRLRF